MMTTEALIAGCGPAGAATALSLGKRGVQSTIVEPALAPAFKTGETIAPNAIPLFTRLGIEALLVDPKHLECFGNRFVWGDAEPADKTFLYNTYTHGYHIDRMYFEQQLNDQVKEQGTEILRGWRVIHCKKENNGWKVTVQNTDGTQQEISCRFIVDATGRSCRIARNMGIQRISDDHLTGIAACFNLPGNSMPHYTFIEAVQGGWWYAAPLSGNRLATTYMTDADLLDPLMMNADHYLQTLCSTSMISGLLHDGITSNDIKLTISTATTSYLIKRCDEGWLAVGDAAFAYDPISSYGITSALDGGYYAGNAIADSLAGFKEALPAYDWLVSSAFTVYKEMYLHQYQLEQRWPEELFWKRRGV